MPYPRQVFTTFEVLTGIPDPSKGGKLSWVPAEDFDTLKEAKAFAKGIPETVAWLLLERRSKVLDLNALAETGYGAQAPIAD